MATKAQYQNEVKKVVTKEDLDRTFAQVINKLDEIIKILCEMRVIIARIGERNSYTTTIERNQKKTNDLPEGKWRTNPSPKLNSITKLTS